MIPFKCPTCNGSGKVVDNIPDGAECRYVPVCTQTHNGTGLVSTLTWKRVSIEAQVPKVNDCTVVYKSAH